MSQLPNQPWVGLVLTTLALLAPVQADTADEASSTHPISRAARIVNPSLAELEGRIGFLSGQLRQTPPYAPKPSMHSQGWRCVKFWRGDDDPSAVIDLGEVYPLGEVFIIPASPQFGDTRTLFPQQIRLESSLSDDFSDAATIYTTPEGTTEDSSSYPVRIPTSEIDARYVKLTVVQGNFRGTQSVASIAEIFVFSGGEPVSLGAKVTATGSMNAEDQWMPEFLTDGRSPLGTWQSGLWTKSRGQVIALGKKDEDATISFDFGESRPLDRVVLFPYELPELGGTSALPGSVSIAVGDSPTPDEKDFTTLRGGEGFTPLTHAMKARSGRYVTIRTSQPVVIGNQRLVPVSEIEIWSLGRNLAADVAPVITVGGEPIPPSPELTDGYANGLEVYPIATWLSRLSDRQTIESELARLHPLQTDMASRSELNVAWGGSLGILLSFAVPLAVHQRRRLVSRKQIDSLRKRIASDLHDDIGSNLGSISLIARSAKRDLARLHSTDTLAEDLNEMETIARESSLAMRDIVWLLERSQDSIGDFITRMRGTAERLLRDVDYKIDCNSAHLSARMTLDAKRHLFLFYKESLHNILKHSGADRVTVEIHDEPDLLVMEVTDNGVGLPLDPDGRPAPGRKLTDRAAVLDGVLKVDSSPGQGTRLRLEVKRSNLIESKAAA